MTNIIKNTWIAAVALSMFSVGFSGCKKGEGDPFLSLRTRKARVAGEWTLASGTTTNKTTGTTTTTTTITYDGVNANETTTVGSNPAVTSTNGYTEKLTFKKDGTFTGTTVDDGNTTTFSGVWNFTGGVGDLKKKEQLVMTFYTFSSGGATTSYTGVTNDETFDIYELKNKEIILKQHSTSSSSGSTNDWTLEMKYKQ